MTSIRELEKLKNISIRRNVWIAVVMFWLLTGYFTNLHEREHVLSSELECQFCLMNFNHTPVVESHSIFLGLAHKAYFIFDSLQPIVRVRNLLCLTNRGPPTI